MKLVTEEQKRSYCTTNLKTREFKESGSNYQY